MTNLSRKRVKPFPYRQPQLDLKTFSLFFVCFFTSLSSAYCASLGWLSSGYLFALNSLAAYGLYTVMHECAHKNISQSSKVNFLVGQLSAIMFLAPFGGFRFIHLTHHRRTNHPKEDPDWWSSRSPVLLTWATQDLFYYWFYLRQYWQRPRPERISLLITTFGLWVGLWYFAASGFGNEVLFGWILPGRFVLLVLSYFFNYLPHYPHQAQFQPDQLTSTRVFPSAWLTPLLLGQNLHLIHHLYPSVPFHLYSKVWKSRKQELCPLGAKVEAKLFTRRNRGQV